MGSKCASSPDIQLIHPGTCAALWLPPSRGRAWVYLRDASAGERNDHGDHIDGQLELQELGDAVVDVPPPHDGFDDAGEVVVRQDDVGRLLRHVRSGDSLTESR